MKPKMKNNVILIITDGIRNYHSDDIQSKLAYMDEFGKYSVEFENVICTAPSSAMSLSAMFTSIPAYYLNKTFSEFTYKNKEIPSLNNILEKDGYRFYGISCTDSGRFVFREIINPVPKKYWNGLDKKADWNDEEMLKIVEMLIPDLKNPFVLTLHYHYTSIKKMSETVKKTMEMLKDAGLWESSIIVLTSDHGYPDSSIPRREIDRRGHDLVMSDDNICVPFYIRYPGSPCGKKISDVISHLDFAPTVLDILGKRYDFQTFHGKSIRGLIEGKHKKMGGMLVRIDNRYIKQPGRITAIRGNKYKYLYYHDKPSLLPEGGSFYDMEKDPKEQEDIIKTKDKKYVKIIKEYRDFFRKSEMEAIDFHKKYLKEKRFYTLRQLWKRKGIYADNPSVILKDVRRRIDILIYRITKILGKPRTSFK